jgi:hypothetical protein
MQLGPGGKPKVRNTPKDVKHGKFTPGDALSFVCKGGDLYVYDAETKETYLILRVLEEFLLAASKLVSGD